MPSKPSEDALANTLLQFVDHGAYPESEDVASAELPRSALPAALRAIEKAREDVQVEISQLGRDAAPDIDGWIAQAKQLQTDIQRSKATAHEIVRQAEQGHKLQAKAEDASSKANLLQTELAFNTTLSAALKDLQSVKKLLDGAQNAAIEDQITETLDKLDAADKVMSQLDGYRDTRFAALLQDRNARIKRDIATTIAECWRGLFMVNTTARRIVLRPEVTKRSAISIDTVVQAKARLESLEESASRFHYDLAHVILRPRLIPDRNGQVGILSVKDNEISITGKGDDSDCHSTMDDIRKMMGYLDAHIPSTVLQHVAKQITTSILSLLIAHWLEPSVPLTLDGMQEFQENLAQVQDLAEYIRGLGWSDADELAQWVSSAPRIWLARRRETALAFVRTSSFNGVRLKQTVERVETQVISNSDVLAGSNTGGPEDTDEWEAEWGETDEQDVPTANAEGPNPAVEDMGDDEDASAWGLEEDDHHDADGSAKQAQDNSRAADEDEGEGEAWGWGDEEGDQRSKEVTGQTSQKAVKPERNGEVATNRPTEHELTLRETYTVTAVPEGIMELIIQLVSDAEALSQPHFSGSPIAPAAAGLFAIPTLILAMYRATAMTYYAKDVAGNMLIYNDCNRLADELRGFIKKQAERDEMSNKSPALQASKKLKLDNDIKALESFAKRAYGKEMESQRTILKDLLDGAQGFSNCTVPPFAAECDNAVAMTVDRIRHVNSEWKDVLSRSALLQSIGSLLATVTSKIIVDIEDMSDIPEAESKRLVQFCNEVSKLNDLFMQESPDGQQSDTTGIYTPNWFKFQYLSEILEGSLADIKYLWTEGELKLEFDADEVIDLIEALFAESDYRRRAIADIKRTAINR